jgi:hypothetical protein
MIWSPFSPVHIQTLPYTFAQATARQQYYRLGLTSYNDRRGQLTSQIQLPTPISFVKRATRPLSIPAQPCSTARTSLEVEDSSHHHSLFRPVDHPLSLRAITALLHQLHTTKSPRDTAVEACAVLQRPPVQAAPCSCALQRVPTTASPLETSVLSAHRTFRLTTTARTSISSSTAASSSALALCRNSLAVTSV